MVVSLRKKTIFITKMAKSTAYYATKKAPCECTFRCYYNLVIFTSLRRRFLSTFRSASRAGPSPTSHPFPLSSGGSFHHSPHHHIQPQERPQQVNQLELTLLHLLRFNFLIFYLWIIFEPSISSNLLVLFF